MSSCGVLGTVGCCPQGNNRGPMMGDFQVTTQSRAIVWRGETVCLSCHLHIGVSCAGSSGHWGEEFDLCWAAHHSIPVMGYIQLRMWKEPSISPWRTPNWSSSLGEVKLYLGISVRRSQGALSAFRGCKRRSSCFESPQESQTLVISRIRWVSVKEEVWVTSTLVAYPRQNSEVTMENELSRSLKNPFLAKQRKAGSWE